MEIHSRSDKKIAKGLGDRIKSQRLSMNMTQKALADATMLSLNAIKSLESGKGKLSTLIAVMRELKILDQLSFVLEDAKVSPLQLAKMQGKQRQRASGAHVNPKNKPRSRDDVEW